MNTIDRIRRAAEIAEIAGTRVELPAVDVLDLIAAIDDALAIIAGGNPDLPGDVLAEVQSRLQEVYDDNDSHPLPNY